MLVAHIAWKKLKPEQRAAAIAILKQHPKYAKDFESAVPEGASEEDHDAIVFMVAATWPDMVKTAAHRDESKDNHRNWHYIDHPIEVGTIEAHPVDVDMTWDPAINKDPKNAVQALAKNYEDLKNGSPAAKAKALCWTLHLVGDLHQPLHCASLFNARHPTGDNGGNAIKVHGGGASELHALWDGLLGRSTDPDFIDDLADDIIAKEKPSAKKSKILDAGAWSLEGRDLAKDVAYEDGHIEDSAAPGAAVNIDQAYLTAAKALARKRASLGGERLARKLTELLPQ
jgi:hypothetical protein